MHVQCECVGYLYHLRLGWATLPTRMPTAAVPNATEERYVDSVDLTTIATCSCWVSGVVLTHAWYPLLALLGSYT